MARGGRGGASRGFAPAFLALATALAWAPAARAFEALDGRVQAHGFGEIQTRTIAEGYARDLDLVQWYNVLSVELEFDVLPDGWGPFDLLQAYVRLEGRYDCVWTRGCGMMRSADSYGDRANKLPRRLADATDDDHGGVIDANDETVPPGHPLRNPDDRVSPLGVFETVVNPPCDPGETPGKSPDFCFDAGLPVTVQNRPDKLVVQKRKGFPGFDTLAELEGADAVLGPNTLQPFALSGTEVVNNADDDPFTYLFEPIEDFRWTFRHKRGALGGTGRTLAMGPWLPKNFVQSIAVLSDRGNPFRGVRTPTANALIAFGAQTGPRQNDDFSYRWTELDDQQRALFPAALTPPAVLPYDFDLVDPRIARDTDGDGDLDFGQAFANIPYPMANNVFSIVNEPLQRGLPPFGGDYTGIIPCQTPDTSSIPSESAAQNQIRAGGTQGCWTNVYNGMLAPELAALNIRGRNIANTGGRGELPMRPAPDLSNLTKFQTEAAQGIFYPSSGLRRALAASGGAFDNSFFNFRESERAWNRGYSQYYTKEFKEGFLDMEFLDSRLWIRAGKQNIVWGKTELFRTTDQFNPQDLALASLPSLEESRTALFALRGVYSFYDVGPLQDVRLELAANFDHVTPADLGACGEPFTPDIVCALTLGYEFHGLTGVGIAGIERPENPWDDAKGIEFGGRVEFRWDRFSVAITDFYGYHDFPHPDPVHFYERNVDTVSGRALIAEGLRGPVNSGRCRNSVPIFVRAGLLQYPAANGGVNGTPVPVSFVVEDGDPNDNGGVTEPGRVPYWNSLSPMTGGLGAGTDPDCLKPGGATGFPNANLLNDIDPVDLDGDTIPDPIYNAPTAGRDGNGDGDFDDPGVDVNGDGDFTDPGEQLPDIPPLYSPQNALEFHSANQQIFAFTCLATVTISASVDGSSCAWNIFGSPNPLVNAPPTPGALGTILSETFSATFAGETTIAGPSLGSQLLNIIQSNQKGASELPVPIRPANRDERDGFSTSLGAIFNVDGIPYNADSTTDLLSLDSVYSAEQRALLGCGPFYGTRCDSSRRDRALGVPEGGGIDFLNAEASALTQSWPGIPGTVDGWTTTSRTLTATSTEPLIQPGTIGFANQAYCTRYDPRSNLANDVGLVRLPGCRGVSDVLTEDLQGLAPGAPIEFLFEAGYDPQVDGCVLGVSDPNNAASRGVAINGHPVRALRIRAKDDPNFDPNDPVGSAEDITARLDLTCGGMGAVGTASTTRLGTPGYAGSSLFRNFAQTAWHPLAGCKTFAQAHDPSDAVRRCNFTTRNFEQEFIDGTAQIFRNEMAIFSWNFLTFLVIASCDSARGGDDLSDPDCFDPRPAGQDDDGNPVGNAAWDPNRCSLAAPQYCRNVKGFLSVAGVQRNDVRAGGSGRFGRLDFSWHSGGELTLQYARRNVFGLSADFAEDVTKTNWGMEFTWFSDVPYLNNDDFMGVSDAQALNLTISVDRPTFINFLNANRTFFINTQWFFQYVTDYEPGGFTSNGPVNVLFTVAVFTGYFQDRLNPNWIFVYDFGSGSGGLLPSLGYRFTENFSVTIGLNYFFGHGQFKAMPVRGYAPTQVRAGENAYKDGVENVLSVIRRRDEAYFRLRYTF